MPTQVYRPEKRFFTEVDFEQMDWRDNSIHAVAFGPGPSELSLDIDYLFTGEQLDSSAPAQQTFWVSPATLVFEGIVELRIGCEPVAAPLTILRIEREPVKPAKLPKKLWLWKIVCTEGEWVFGATGYRQVIRRPPELVSRPRLEPGERGGYTLACPDR
jgi:hypothetical protein